MTTIRGTSADGDARRALRPREGAKAQGISSRTFWGLTSPRRPVPCFRTGHGRRQTVLYPVAEMRARLSQRVEAATLGLKSAVIGRTKTTTGEWLAEFIERLAEQQAGQKGGGE